MIIIRRVIAYWDNRAYAFSGRIPHSTPMRNGYWWVEFDDGDKAWISYRDVHKRVSLW